MFGFDVRPMRYRLPGRPERSLHQLLLGPVRLLWGPRVLGLGLLGPDIGPGGHLPVRWRRVFGRFERIVGMFVLPDWAILGGWGVDMF